MDYYWFEHSKFEAQLQLSIWPELILGKQTVMDGLESLVDAASQFLAVYPLSPM